MINNNTLLELNNTEFGANINKIESYVIDSKQLNTIENNRQYYNEYKKYINILKNVKPSSVAFSEETDIEAIENTQYDKLLVEFPEQTATNVYGNCAENLAEVFSDISNNQEPIDIIAIPCIQGIAISATYTDGALYKVYVVKEDKKYLDITEDVKDIIPEYIEDIEDNSITDFRGIITTTDNNLEYKNNIKCSIIHRLRTHINIDKLQIIFTDLYSTNTNYGTKWEKIEFMKGIELNVPHHALIRNIDKTLISDAMEQLREHFTELMYKEHFAYTYENIIICNNTNNKYFIYNYSDCNPEDIFESTVKAININNNKNYMYANIKILDVLCNDKLVISNIDVNDILDIVNCGINIGSKVKFRVVNKKAILVNS